MKKFIYVAMMAVVVLFASCKGGYNNSAYYLSGNEVKIDEAAGTVNGKKYDNKTEKCWMWTLTEKTQGTTINHEYYVWGTEFYIVSVCEMEMYECSISGRVAEYSYLESPSNKTEEACENANRQ